MARLIDWITGKREMLFSETQEEVQVHREGVGNKCSLGRAEYEMLWHHQGKIQIHALVICSKV